MDKHPLHLKNPELQTSPEVAKAVKRQEHQTAEKVPNDPSARIEAYMDRLENVFLNPDEHKRERNLEMLRPKIYDALIIKKENFPESYFELQQRIARERGQAVEHIPANVRDQMMDTAIADQKASLDAWMEYLTSNDAVYPTWFKYFVWRNITKLSQFDKERGEFKRRTDSTVAPFPDIYREPLAQIADIYEKVKTDNKNLKEPEIKESFSKKFPALYAELIQKSLIAQAENKEQTTAGEWIRYAQGNKKDAAKLFSSLENKGTGWCTAGQMTAEVQIKSGDFYVYYTNDKTSQPTQPRLAIRMEEQNKIGEVRGVLPHQEVEPIMQEVLDKKLAEFGSEADAYKKKSADMRHLTELEKKQEKNEPFTKEDLIFLYEIDSPIEGFGYTKDPRVEELRDQRNTEQDMPVIFDCQLDQIAHNQKEINKNTKVYVGEWNMEVFQKVRNYPDIKHLFESFPDKKIFMQTLETDPFINSSKSAKEVFKRKNIYLSDWGKDILHKTEFSKKTQKYELARFTVGQLGFTNGATTDEIYKRAEGLGLELCPAEVGPHLRLQYSGTEWMLIAMKQISDRHGGPHVFNLYWHGDQLELDGSSARPSDRWDSGFEFVFRFRKFDSKKL